MNGDLKMTFIRKCLADYMSSVQETMRIAFRKYKVGVTDEGVQSLASETLENSAMLRFKEYLRFVDMGVGKSHPLGGLTSMKVALRAHNDGVALIKDRTRKPKKIYSKVAWGKLTWLENKLMHGYTDETKAMLKKTIEDGSLVT